MRTRLTIILLLIIGLQMSHAHGPIHEKIERVTKEISDDPYNIKLYIERSSYYSIDGDFDRASADLLTVRRLNSEIPTLDFLAAELCFDFEKYHSALAYINNFETREISLGETYLLKSKILDKLFESDSALHYIGLAYKHKRKYKTGFFLMASQFAVYADKDDYETAKQWLLTGRQHLPHDLVLQKERIALAMKYENYDDAIAVCNEQLPKLKRKEKWQYELATIYVLKGDKENALRLVRDAQASIEALPRHHTSTDYIKNLTIQINELFNQLTTAK